MPSTIRSEKLKEIRDLCGLGRPFAKGTDEITFLLVTYTRGCREERWKFVRKWLSIKKYIGSPHSIWFEGYVKKVNKLFKMTRICQTVMVEFTTHIVPFFLCLRCESLVVYPLSPSIILLVYYLFTNFKRKVEESGTKEFIRVV